MQLVTVLESISYQDRTFTSDFIMENKNSLIYKMLLTNGTNFLCELKLILQNNKLSSDEKIKLIQDIDLKYAILDRNIILNISE